MVSSQRILRSQRLKRTLDIGIASVGIIATAPIALLAAVALWFSVGSPVLFKQKRTGLNGKPFTLLKFRTMKDIRDEEGNLLPDEKRLTKVGRIIRALSIDELPELLHVLKGDMSIVGPRPLMHSYYEEGLYSEEQNRRHSVKPGITGWAQIHGRNAHSWEQRFAYDIWYVDHRNILLDLKIILKTILVVLKREGIGHGGKDTMPPFRGNVKVQRHDMKDTKELNQQTG